MSGETCDGCKYGKNYKCEHPENNRVTHSLAKDGETRIWADACDKREALESPVGSVTTEIEQNNLTLVFDVDNREDHDKHVSLLRAKGWQPTFLIAIPNTEPSQFLQQLVKNV